MIASPIFATRICFFQDISDMFVCSLEECDATSLESDDPELDKVYNKYLGKQRNNADCDTTEKLNDVRPEVDDTEAGMGVLQITLDNSIEFLMMIISKD